MKISFTITFLFLSLVSFSQSKSIYIAESSQNENTTSFDEYAKRIDANGIYNFHQLNSDQYNIAEYKMKRVPHVYRKDGYTEVKLVKYVSSNFYYFNISENTYLEDMETGVMYKLHSVKHDVPISRNVVISNAAGKLIYMTLIFPPLAKDVKFVNYVPMHDPNVLDPPNIPIRNIIKDLEVQTQEKQDSDKKIIELDPDFKVD
ncbi:MAG: hypothetical protein R3Y26_11865 [Rikenellaceae bacterium]